MSEDFFGLAGMTPEALRERFEELSVKRGAAVAASLSKRDKPTRDAKPGKKKHTLTSAVIQGDLESLLE